VLQSWIAGVASTHAIDDRYEERFSMHMATRTKQWTLEEVHSLPDDGNKYELVRGDLFVTPPPSEDHETILARLSRILDPYVAANGLGMVYHPRSVMRFEGSEVEPDLMVRQPRTEKGRDWDEAPTPILVVEVLSGSTRRRDHVQKRELYLDAGVPEYWILDPESVSVRVVRARRADVVITDRLTWSPRGAEHSLSVDVAAVFS
jgi:Uma2 family endonuclease